MLHVRINKPTNQEEEEEEEAFFNSTLENLVYSQHQRSTKEQNKQNWLDSGSQEGKRRMRTMRPHGTWAAKHSALERWMERAKWSVK